MVRNINEITMDNYDEVRYLLSSEIRLKILRLLLESDMNTDKIKEYLDKQDTTILRTLKELQDLNLVETYDKTYSLTSTGYLAARNIMNVLDNWKIVTKYYRCFNYHSFKKFPIDFARYSFILDESERIAATDEDFDKTRKLYEENIKDATDLKIVLPIYSKQYLGYIIDVLKRNDAKLQLVTSRNIYEAIKNSMFWDDFKQLKKKGNIRLWVSEKDIHEIYLTLTDTNSSVSFFYHDETFDDTTFFWKKEFKTKKMLEHLFQSYKYRMSTKEVI